MGKKKSKVLTQGCLAQGSRAGMGGKIVKVMVAISRSKGVVICERYEKLNAQYFASFIDQHLTCLHNLAKDSLDSGCKTVILPKRQKSA